MDVPYELATRAMCRSNEALHEDVGDKAIFTNQQCLYLILYNFTLQLWGARSDIYVLQWLCAIFSWWKLYIYTHLLSSSFMEFLTSSYILYCGLYMIMLRVPWSGIFSWSVYVAILTLWFVSLLWKKGFSSNQ